ncbi:hypothetical protein U0070_025030, partial [Myodes glareolus]
SPALLRNSFWAVVLFFPSGSCLDPNHCYCCQHQIFIHNHLILSAFASPRSRLMSSEKFGENPRPQKVRKQQREKAFGSHTKCHLPEYKFTGFQNVTSIQIH